jgi:membrane protease YdiL (CAAX protease family)
MAENSLNSSLQNNSLGTALSGHVPGRAVQGIEVAIFLLLILPSMGSAFLLQQEEKIPFTAMAISSILSDVALVSLVLYFVWRNGETLRQLGWTWGRRWRDVLIGAALFFPAAFGASSLEAVLHAAGLSAPSKLPSFLVAKGVSKEMLAFVLVMVVAVAEETIFRGYLILRLRTVAGGTGAAVLLSSFIFSLGHGYEGAAGMISVFFLGVVFALVYVWRKSLVAPMVMHFLVDFTSIVLIALTGPRL